MAVPPGADPFMPTRRSDQILSISIPNSSEEDAFSPSVASPFLRTATAPYSEPSHEARGNYSVIDARDPQNEVTVLPSPAPSEDACQGQAPTALGSPYVLGGPRSATPRSRTSSHGQTESERLLELVAKYGGVSGLEKQLQQTQQATQPVRVVTNHARQNSSPQVQSRSGSAQARANGAGPFRPPSSAASTPTSASPSIMAPAIAAQAGHLQTRTTNSPVAADLQDLLQTGTPIPSSADALRDEALVTCKSALEQGREDLKKMDIVPAERKQIDEARLVLLIEACDCKDIACLALHQLYCLLHLHPEVLPNVSSSRHGQEGLKVLGTILAPNSSLLPQSLRWFSKFPGPMPVLLRQSTKYRAAMIAAYRDIPELGKEYQNLHNSCYRQRTPPFACTIERFLGLKSPTLQRVIFKAILRSLWPHGLHDGCRDSAESFFDREQEGLRALKQRLPGKSTELSIQVTAHRRSLMNEYLTTLQRHMAHIRAGNTAVSASHQTLPHPVVPSSLHNQASSNLPIPSSLPHQNTYTQHFVHLDQQSPQVHQNAAFSPASTRPQSRPQSRRPSNNQPIIRSNVLPNLGPNAIIGSGSYHPNRQVQGETPQQVTRSAETTRPPRSHMYQSDEGITHEILQRAIPHLRQGDSWPGVRLLPNASYILPTIPQPPDFGFSLHKAHLRDPELLIEQPEGGPKPSDKMFSYLAGFLVDPIVIPQHTSTVNRDFALPPELESNMPDETPDPFGAPAKKVVRPGSHIIRFRSIRAKQAAPAPSAGEWAVADTSWPSSLALGLNGKVLDVRRKPENGKDQPIDISARLQSDTPNQLRAAFLRRPNTPDLQTVYAVAVEVLAVASRETILASVVSLGPWDTLGRIRAALRPPDADVEVLSTELTLAVTDPFTSKLVAVPVRGAECSHLECFDLPVFLETRQPDLRRPEQWRCPICGRDARPDSLRRDPWFAEMVDELRKMGREDIRAVLVNEEGKCRVKEEEKQGESGDGTGARKSAGPEKSVSGAAPDVEVIELD